MPLNNKIPQNSKLAIIGGVFKGVLGSPSPGKYDFINYSVAGVLQNNAVELGLRMRPNFLYFFHQIQFSMSIPEGDFLAAIDPGTVPTLTVRESTTRNNIFYAPFRLFRYFENGAADSFHFNLNENASIIADFQAVLSQTAALIGIDTVYAQVSFSVYEITDKKFIEEFKKAH